MNALLCLFWSVVLLLVLPMLIQPTDLMLHIMLLLPSGFTRANSVAVSDKITTIDRVTWRERKLFFATATSHMKNGCPLLALEVMTRLPPTLDSEREQDCNATRTTAQNEVSYIPFISLSLFLSLSFSFLYVL